ncbi:MAG TPA: LiaF domain-containing protein, partial [Gemmatimonadales bacterium]|nr:LiaF domain-containing protein [Gemmatimonadales bacterium]
PAGMLYQMSADYDADRYQPLTRYESESQSVALGLEPTGSGGLRVSSREHLAQSADIQLSRMVPLTLDITLGAAEGTLDLGGLRLRQVRLETAGSRTAVRFSQVNPGHCDTLAVKSGAAEVTLESLGNSRCDAIRIDGGAGGVTLDLGGAWAGDGKIAVAVAVGQVRLRIPRDLGVELSLEQFLSSFEAKGFVREGKVWRTPGFAQAGHRVALHLSTTVGGVNVAWVP